MHTANQRSDKEIVLSLSKANNDFIVTCSRSSGPGGQNVNRRLTKVRISHPASGATGESQTYRTQGANKKEALRRLVKTDQFMQWLKVYIAKKNDQTIPEEPSGPTGSRGEKIRTYNYLRDQVIDHRIGFKTSPVQDILNGELDEIITELQKEAAKCRLANKEESR